jgi:PST family polysaccharide transporter
VWSLVAGSLFLAAASTALGWIYSGWRPQWVLALSEIRSVLGFSMNLTGFVMVNYFSRNAGHLIAGRHLGAEALGYYQMAYALLLYPLQAMAWVLGRVMFAAFARMQTDLERFRSGFQRYLTLLGAIFFPVFLGLTVVADPLIRLFLGPKWLPVIPLFMIVAPFGALHAITSPSGQIYLSSGRTDVMLKVGVASMVVQVFGYLAGVPWGLRGILLGWAIASVPAGIAGLVVSHRIIGARVGPLLRNLRGPAGAALAMMAAAWCWRWFLDVLGITSAAVDLVSTTITGAAVYLVLVLLPRPEFLRDVGRILTYSDQAILLRLRAWMARYVPD